MLDHLRGTGSAPLPGLPTLAPGNALFLAFFTFGLTDFREAYVLESWLVWVKLLNLVLLIWLRSIAVRRWYPESRLF